MVKMEGDPLDALHWMALTVLVAIFHPNVLNAKSSFRSED
jgi:hypothetical protein